MSSRPETSLSALGRLHTDLEGVAQIFATGSSALPRLAMGSDPEGMVHVALDARGEVVGVDLDPSWRAVLTPADLEQALARAVQQATAVRTGDWAAAVAAAAPDTRGRTARPAGAESGRRAADPPAPIAVDPAWLATLDDRALTAALIGALASRPDAVPHATTRPGARPLDVSELEARTYATLLDRAAELPPFMRLPLEASFDRVHDDVGQALTLPLASEAAAGEPLRGFASRLDESLWLAGRPAGLPTAAELWATAALGLTSGLADSRRSRRRMLPRLRGRSRVAT